MPPAVEIKSAVGMALYSAKAVLHGKAGDVLETVRENL
jgi:pyruvate dehydrogenase (quinone)